MEISKLLSMVDHTLLSQTTSEADIKDLCSEAIKYGTASVCIPPYYVKTAKRSLGDSVPVCTVIGFPNGYNTTETKCFETKNAVEHGADEIDAVINIGLLKENHTKDVLHEIEKIRKNCEGKILKVIIETCLLTEAEKITMCHIVTESGADFIKTSTGFASSGAKLDDIALFAANIGPKVKIKAAGGISSIADAEKFIELGASRLGTSRIVKIVKQQNLL